MHRIINHAKALFVGCLLVTAIASTAAPAFAATVVNPKDEICQGTGGGAGTDSNGNAVPCTGQTGTSDDLGAIFKTIVNVLLYIIGAVAVIVIVIGGLRYVTSAGNASSVTAAKNTILYAVIGLVIAILAFAIVNFVIKSF